MSLLDALHLHLRQMPGNVRASACVENHGAALIVQDGGVAVADIKDEQTGLWLS